MKVLITDTNSDLTEHVCFVIKKLQPDWELVIAQSGLRCLDMLGNGLKPDVVLAGMHLSDMSGYDLIKRIRDDSDVPIVLLSEDHNVELLVKAFETGANDYMTKPYHDAVFIARLKALARRRAWDIQKIENEISDYEFSEGIKG
jgi:PleD family two-component response regulator